MKAHEIEYNKTGGKLIPLNMEGYFNFLSEIKEGESVRASFSIVKESKTARQLAYLYGVVYPFCMYWFKETRGDVLYENEMLGFKHPVKVSKESVDFLFKTLFGLYKHEDMQKSRMSKEEMSEYIDFIDKWSIENFGYPIPDAGKEQGA